MLKRNTALAVIPVERDPLRAALASAIEQERDARAKHDHTAAAIRIAEDAMHGIYGDNGRALDAVEAARSEMGIAARRHALAQGPAPDHRKLNDALAMEAQTRERLDTAQAALAELSEPLREQKFRLERCVYELEQARYAVMLAAVPEIMRKTEAARREIAVAASALAFMSDGVHSRLDHVAGSMMESRHGPEFEAFRADDREALSAWCEAYAALALDPDAPLPV